MQWRDRHDDQVGTSDSWIVEQCGAFLAGSYRELLMCRRQPIPAWTWINVLAHGNEEEVRRRAAEPVGTDGCDAYLARLARHTLVKMRTEGVSLRAVQRAILIPLELALIGSVGSATAEEATLSQAVARELLRGLDPILVGGEEA